MRSKLLKKAMVVYHALSLPKTSTKVCNVVNKNATNKKFLINNAPESLPITIAIPFIVLFSYRMYHSKHQVFADPSFTQDV